MGGGKVIEKNQKNFFFFNNLKFYFFNPPPRHRLAMGLRFVKGGKTVCQPPVVFNKKIQKGEGIFTIGAFYRQKGRLGVFNSIFIFFPFGEGMGFFSVFFFLGPPPNPRAFSRNNKIFWKFFRQGAVVSLKKAWFFFFFVFAKNQNPKKFLLHFVRILKRFLKKLGLRGL